jgi:hypothetical protein
LHLAQFAERNVMEKSDRYGPDHSGLMPASFTTLPQEMEPRILAIADERAAELFAEGSPADPLARECCEGTFDLTVVANVKRSVCACR